MSQLARFFVHAFMLVSLVAVLAGCRQPQVDNGASWSDRWSEQWSTWSAHARDKFHRPAEVPAPRADEQMATARLLEHQGEVDRAIGVYNEIVQKDNRRADAHHRLALLYDVKGQTDAALKHYQQALKKNPKDTELLTDLGYHYYLARDTKQAETVLRRTIEQHPTQRAHNNLALVLARSGRYDEALAEFDRAGNKPAIAHVNLAYALIWDEHWEEAAQQINLALATDPSSKNAQQALASLSSLIDKVNRTDEAATIQVGYEERAQ
jgi:tetratricopeptide (TPR) repeat protein